MNLISNKSLWIILIFATISVTVADNTRESKTLNNLIQSIQENSEDIVLRIQMNTSPEGKLQIVEIETDKRILLDPEEITEFISNSLNSYKTDNPGP